MKTYTLKGDENFVLKCSFVGGNGGVFPFLLNCLFIEFWKLVLWMTIAGIRYTEHRLMSQLAWPVSRLPSSFSSVDMNTHLSYRTPKAATCNKRAGAQTVFCHPIPLISTRKSCFLRSMYNQRDVLKQILHFSFFCSFRPSVHKTCFERVSSLKRETRTFVRYSLPFCSTALIGFAWF